VWANAREESVREWGADATRMGLADAGDAVDDANFVEDFANKCILRLYTLVEWVKVRVPPPCRVLGHADSHHPGIGNADEHSGAGRRRVAPWAGLDLRRPDL
jgi:leucyl-tRNA synthetase